MVLCFPTWFRLIQEWTKWEQSLAHGLPTFLLYLGLFTIHPPTRTDSDNRQSDQRQTAIEGLGLLTVVLVWAILELIRIDTLAYLMLPVVLLAVTATLLGYKPTVVFLPYVLLLSLSLPIWADLIPALVKISSAVVSTWVAGFGVTALIEGSNITLPFGRLIIANGCSGIGYLAISILLASTISILNDYKAKGWLIMICGAVLLALLINWVRITALVLIAYYSDMKSDLVANHELFGWLLFAAFVIPITMVIPAHTRHHNTPATPPIVTRNRFVFVIAAFMAGTLTITLLQSTQQNDPIWTLSNPDARSDVGSSLPIALSFPQQFDHQVWNFQVDSVWISIAQTQRQSADEKLVPYLHNPIDPEQWYEDQKKQGNLVKVYRRVNGLQRTAYAQWFQIGTYRTSNYTFAKLLQIPATFLGQTRFAVVTLQSNCNAQSCDSAIQKITETSEHLTLQPKIL
ncbi:exosortase/archaeosortase family protein [Marinobacter caseinilyticus]|uniref:exosortase/archaeosortase family protein n=1 Tax=Marinobacter caseinilyticus TaxID=2692195 RepID=UPI00140A452D|nr:exosortase/archaeosortase family protein [Marinobacter caseinilyticus]